MKQQKESPKKAGKQEAILLFVPAFLLS